MALTYGTSTSLACTSFNSLANSLTAVASSAAATTGTSNNIVDAIVRIKITGPATMTASASTVVNIFAYGSEDGTAWAGGGTTNELIDGTDKAITWSSNGNNARFLGSVVLHTTSAGTSVVYNSEPYSIASAFGGTLPRKWCILIQNQSSATLHSSGHEVKYTEVYYS